MDTRHEPDKLYEDQDCIIIYVGKLAGNPQWSFPTHKHDDLHEIIYVNEGKGSFTIDGAKHLAQRETCSYTIEEHFTKKSLTPNIPYPPFIVAFVSERISIVMPIGSYLQVVNQSFAQTGIRKSCIR